MSDFETPEHQKLAFFDVNCRLGPSDFSVPGSPTSVPALFEEMDRLGIGEALVFHANASGYAPAAGNQELVQALRGQSRLSGCWIVLPHHTGEMAAPRDLVREALSEGIRTVRLLPRLHRFSLAEWSADELLGQLEEHRIPVLLDFGRTHWAEDVVDYGQVTRICATFPALPLVLMREGIASLRYLYPLLERFANLHLDISYFQASGGLADVTRRFGARRLLFGTGLPEYSGGPAVAMLCYADLSIEDKRRIAGDNLRDLLSGVQ